MWDIASQRGKLLDWFVPYEGTWNEMGGIWNDMEHITELFDIHMLPIVPLGSYTGKKELLGCIPLIGTLTAVLRKVRHYVECNKSGVQAREWAFIHGLCFVRVARDR